MTQFRVVKGDQGWSWKLVSVGGADLIARGARWHPDELRCRGDIRSTIALADAGVVVAQPGPHWRWQLLDTGGAPLARSAEAFGNERACVLSLQRFQLQMRILHSSLAPQSETESAA